MRTLTIFIAITVATSAAAAPKLPPLPDVGEEVEVYSGQVTALSCALKAQELGKLDFLQQCTLSEMAKGLVVYDVSEQVIFQISNKAVYRYELEKAAGGGSIDFEGAVVKVKGRIATVDVEDYSITARPKPGAFKGCL